MNIINAFETIPGPSVAECPTNFNTDEDAMRMQPDEVPRQIKTNTSIGSDRKSVKNPVKDGKLLMKRKKSNRLPISQMVMEAIKALKKRNGASMEDILKYIEDHYKLNAKLVKRYVTRYLQSAVHKAVIEQLCGAGQEERFKIKKIEKVSKDGLKLKTNQKKSKAVRK